MALSFELLHYIRDIQEKRRLFVLLSTHMSLRRQNIAFYVRIKTQIDVSRTPNAPTISFEIYRSFFYQKL